MTAERWQKVDEILQAALDLQPNERAAFLDEACAGDDELRHEISSLLARENSAEHFIETSAMKVVARGLAEADLSGQQISHYQILNPIGEGGMGKVYLATDSKLNRNVAIKFLPEAFTADPERVRRFRREAHAAAALNHPNIMTVYEVGDDANLPYFTCEHIAGVTLRERMQSGALPWQEIAKIASQIADALQTAHKSGIIHRDIKPENVMLRSDGLAKVLDFGIAKHLDLMTFDSTNEAQPTNGKAAINVYQTNFTRTQDLLGTLNYMSPEQARREELTPQTDVFSFGLMLYELLAEHPYAAMSPAEKLSALQSADELPSLGKLRPDIPTALAELVTQATRKEMAARTITAQQMHSTLAEFHSSLEMRTTGQSKQLAQERANKLLNQVAALYANDSRTRLSLTEWWTIKRRSNAVRGKLEQKLLRQSLFSILGKAAGVAALAGLLTFGAASWISITERFTSEQYFRDGHNNLVRQFTLSPDGKKLVSVSHDATIIVWDFVSRARLATLKHNNQQRITAVAFAPDSQSFATACADGKVNVWDAKSYALQVVVPGSESGVNRILFSPNGRWLLTATGGQQHTLWEVGSWKKVHDFAAPGLGSGTNPLVSPNSRFLLSQFWELFDLEKGVALNSRSLPSWSNSSLSPDAKQLVTVDPSNWVSFWDIQQMWTGGQKRLLKRETAYRDRGRAVAYSPDGRYVATAGEAILLWDAVAKTKLARFTYPQYPWQLEFTPDSKSLVASYGDAQLLVWDVEEREQKFSFVGHSNPVRAVAYSPDGKLVASAGDDRSVILWDAATRQKRTVFSQHDARISSLEFSRDGKWLTSTDINGRTFIWDVVAKQERLHFETPERWEVRFGFALSYSPDQRWLATSFGVHSSTDGRMVVDFDNKSGYSNATDAQEYYALRFSPDGRWMAGVRSTPEVYLWNTATWTLEQRAQVKQEGSANLISLAFSPDGRWFVTGQDQGQVRLWSVEPLREVAVIGEHKSFVRAVVFSHDGRFVASASDDKTLKLWDIARRKLVEEIGIHTSPVLAVSFSPDDKHLVTGEYDNSVRVYTRERKLWGWKLE